MPYCALAGSAKGAQQRSHAITARRTRGAGPQGMHRQWAESEMAMRSSKTGASASHVLIAFSVLSSSAKAERSAHADAIGAIEASSGAMDSCRLPFAKTPRGRTVQSIAMAKATASPRARPAAMGMRYAQLSTHFSDALRAYAAHLSRWCAGMLIALTITGVPGFFLNGFNKRGDHVVS
jgi:hypothetical protein